MIPKQQLRDTIDNQAVHIRLLEELLECRKNMLRYENELINALINKFLDESLTRDEVMSLKKKREDFQLSE